MKNSFPNPKLFVALFLLAFVALFGTGCATAWVGHGSTFEVPITSAPSKADVYTFNIDMSKSTAQSPVKSGTTPYVMKGWKNKAYGVLVTQDTPEGTKAAVYIIAPKAHWRAIAQSLESVLFGFPGLVGLVVDPASGAWMQPNKKFIFVDFDELKPSLVVDESWGKRNNVKARVVFREPDDGFSFTPLP